MTRLKAAVLAEIKRQGTSRYALSKSVEGFSEMSVRRYLYTDGWGAREDMLDAICDALGLELRSTK